jgi:hypothetical protein
MSPDPEPRDLVVPHDGDGPVTESHAHGLDRFPVGDLLELQVDARGSRGVGRLSEPRPGLQEAARGTQPRSGGSRWTSQLLGVETGGATRSAIGAGFGGELPKRIL